MDINAYYAKRAKYYDMINAHKYKEVVEEVHFFKRHTKELSKHAKTILDIGCGTGRISIPLSREGFEVVGIDTSREMLAIAKKKAGNRKNLRFEIADLRTYLPKERFDCAVCGDASLATFLSKRSLISALKHINADLKDNGIFFYDIWNYAEYKGWKPVSSRVIREGNIELSLNRETSVDLHGIYKFRDKMTIKKSDKAEHLTMTYISKVWTYPGLLEIFKQAGFRKLLPYSNLKHIKYFNGVPERLYLIALK